jgi:heme/copper-type cytochrome/quinol oxidase subunit 3
LKSTFDGTADGHVATRALALLRLSEDVPRRLVAWQLGTSQNFIVSARQRFMLLGLHGLHVVGCRAANARAGH